MTIDNIHIYIPEIIETSIRILPAYKLNFIPEKFIDFKTALAYGLVNFQKGFRIFRQNTHEWYAPDNILLAKINDVRREVL